MIRIRVGWKLFSLPDLTGNWLVSLRQWKLEKIVITDDNILQIISIKIPQVSNKVRA